MTTTPAPGVTPEIEALLPCPFCGGVPDDTHAGGAPALQEDSHTNIYVWCPSCGAKGLVIVGGHGGTREEAIAAWNRRAQPIPGTVGVRELEWSATSHVTQRAYVLNSGFHYTIERGSKHWRLYWGDHYLPLGAFDSEAEAKAAAQADFEARIRSALTQGSQP